jgi:anti-anti-sigma regulatory factor
MARARTLSVQLISEQSGWGRLVLAGCLDEHAKEVLEAIIPKAPAKLIIDFGGVEQLNSSGIRDWSLFIKKLKANRIMVIENCPEEVVRAINMVPYFAAGIPIKSVHRTYACEGCKGQQVETFTLGRDYNAGELPQIPKKTCKKCGTEVEPAEPDDEFFIFLTAP